jgi:uncharacterized membrane protein SirB2
MNLYEQFQCQVSNIIPSCYDYMVFFKIIGLPKAKSGIIFHKSSELLPLLVKNLSHAILLISIGNIVFKREQSETRRNH